MINGLFKEISEEEKMNVNGGKSITINVSKVVNAAGKVANTKVAEKVCEKVAPVAVKVANTVVNWYTNRNKK